MGRPELPSGTVTLLFTDIEGSTGLIDKLGEDNYVRALADHRRILRSAFKDHGGVEVDTEGDAFFYVFVDAREAIAGAAQGQEALRSAPIRVRMGLHTAMLRLTGEGYAGRELHRAARIAASGHGGQVVVSAATRALVDGELVELGRHRLKDFDEPIPLFQLGRERFPPLKTISNTTLPRPASSFVGRTREWDELLRLLRKDTRLVTLTGPGGSGKTRLAIEAASELVPEFSAGVFWVTLAPLHDPALVTEAIALTLGAKEGLAGHIGERALLMLLDNFEHVVAAAPELSHLLEDCPNLKMLVTSRELLRIRGEIEYPVPPLAEPEAVELFSERSQLEADETIAEICRRLDEQPLAIELAAARTRVLTPAQMLERLGDRLDLLKGGRDAEERQQTLRTTIEWSHDLLDGPEQELFARLAVFRGGCNLAAAEVVCDADLDVLQSLVDKSLLRHTADRFWMLETIRAFAAERLEAADGSEQVRSAHAEFFASLAELAGAQLRGPDQQEWADRLSVDYDNIRAAIEYGLGRDPEIALRIVGSLPFYVSLRGGLGEARSWVTDALAAGTDASPLLRGRALLCGATAAHYQGDVDAASRYAEEAFALASAAGDGFVTADALRERGIAAAESGHMERARALFEELVEFAQKVGDAWNGAVALNNLGDLALYDGDWARAIELCQQSSDIRRGLGNRWGAALSLCNVALAQRELGLLDDAARSVREALEDSLAVDAMTVVLACFEIGALLAADRGRPREAAVLLGAHDQLREELETTDPDYERSLLEGLQAKCHALLGDEEFARAFEHGRSLILEDAAALVVAVTLDA